MPNALTKEIAEALNGSEYPLRIPGEIRSKAKGNKIVIVYGASDDLMELDGAVYDEIGAYGGATAAFTPKGLLTNECEDDGCPYFAKAKDKAVGVSAVWDNGDGRSWIYETAIPHETFDVREDGKIYCTGIVFALADVPAY